MIPQRELDEQARRDHFDDLRAAQHPAVRNPNLQALHRLAWGAGRAYERDALTADLARVEAERDRLRQDRDAFRNLAERYQIEHNREWDQGACQCPRCQPFHDLFMASLRADGNVRKALTAEPARAEEGASDEQ